MVGVNRRCGPRQAATGSERTLLGADLTHVRRPAPVYVESLAKRPKPNLMGLNDGTEFHLTLKSVLRFERRAHRGEPWLARTVSTR